jgi:hypothetical protein
LADSRFVPPIDLLTFPPIGGTFFRIQEGSKPMSLEILFYIVRRFRKKASLGTRMGSDMTFLKCTVFIIICRRGLLLVPDMAADSEFLSAANHWRSHLDHFK